MSNRTVTAGVRRSTHEAFPSATSTTRDYVRRSIDGLECPIVLEARPGTSVANDQAAALQWLREHRNLIEQELVGFGAVLLRGFSFIKATGFSEASAIIGESKLKYVAGATPRERIHGNVYESTQWPAFFKIKLHNEMSYLQDYPEKILFYCDVPPAAGGETILCDMRKIYREVDVSVRERFERLGVKYLRTFQGERSALIQRAKKLARNNMHRTWREAFKTADRTEVEDICRRQKLRHTWLERDWLLVENVLPAVITHPVSGVPIWFNQVTSMHPNQRSLGFVYWYLKMLYHSEDTLPFNVRFGDGTKIPFEMIDHVYDALDHNTIAFPWQGRDLLIVDNRSISHGRNPFKGARTILVSLLNN